MLRKNYMITEKQSAQLDAEAKKTGLKLSAIVRKALDQYFKGDKTRD